MTASIISMNYFILKTTERGIANDANLWATETVNNAVNPTELLLRVITISLETM
ncbi:MAG: hypothetical protein ABL921_29415 [Pirellula sp.]